MAKVRIKWDRRALERLAASIDYASDAMEYTCPQCGTVFHPRDGKIVCPGCGLTFLPPGQRPEIP